jgi:hypothetical protein
LFTTILTCVLSLEAWREFDPTSPGFQFVEQHDWLSHAISYKLGVDGFSLPFVLLTTFLMPFCIAASWVSFETRVKEYMIAFLVLEALMTGVFLSLERRHRIDVVATRGGDPRRQLRLTLAISHELALQISCALAPCELVIGAAAHGQD